MKTRSRSPLWHESPATPGPGRKGKESAWRLLLEELALLSATVPSSTPPTPHPSPPANQPQWGPPVSGEAAVMLKAPADAPPWATNSLGLPEPLVIEKKEYACKWRLLG